MSLVPKNPDILGYLITVPFQPSPVCTIPQSAWLGGSECPRLLASLFAPNPTSPRVERMSMRMASYPRALPFPPSLVEECLSHHVK